MESVSSSLGHIAFCAPKHSGKSTCAQHLVQSYGYSRLALADPVKNSAVAAINAVHDLWGIPPIDRAFLDAHKDEVFVPFLQWLGTEYGRRYYGTPTRWIDLFLQATLAVTDTGGRVVCDDVRYQNEADALRAAGFTIIKIVRSPEERRRSLMDANLDPSIMEHASETELTSILPDIYFYADKGVLDMLAGLDRLLARLADNVLTSN